MIMHDDRPGYGRLAAGSGMLLLLGSVGVIRRATCCGSITGSRDGDSYVFGWTLRGAGDSAGIFVARSRHAGRSETCWRRAGVGEVVDDRRVRSGGGVLWAGINYCDRGRSAKRDSWAGRRCGTAWAPFWRIGATVGLQRCSDALQASGFAVLQLVFHQTFCSTAPRRCCDPRDYQAMLRLPRPKTLRVSSTGGITPVGGFGKVSGSYYGEVLGDFGDPRHRGADDGSHFADDPLVPVDFVRGPRQRIGAGCISHRRAGSRVPARGPDVVER